MAERNTKQKEVIMKFLEQNKNRHLSIEDIQEGIGRTASMVTVYRMINKMVSENLIIKKPLENKQGFCYQFNEICSKCNHIHNHYHLICSKCNKVFHYDNTKIAEICTLIGNDIGFQVESEKLAFYGVCKNCLAHNS